ncbi:hypothetical protein BDQ17DRAFT_1537988 [Cyathus striatus]|nr:hypothetical protein BDQ17DRAFT_1537988 [Cyathus striatus]
MISDEIVTWSTPLNGPHSPSSKARRYPRARLLIFCDGMEIPEDSEKCSNIMRLSIAISTQGTSADPTRQIVYYSSGKKDEQPQYVTATTCVPLADHVIQAYTFISTNYLPGDEIYIFGFSSGACVARMLSNLIGEIGILERKHVHTELAGIFFTYQKLGKTKNVKKRQKLKGKLAPWTSPDSPGKKTLKLCLGLFETVGSLGTPDQNSISFKMDRKTIGFSDRTLGEHVQCAYQAFALHETRPRFNCNKLEQTESSKRKGQVLKQCWFSGDHLDIGGGYPERDLADLALTWMVANLSCMLPVKIDYLLRKIEPVAPWGKQKPHNFSTGKKRSLPGSERLFPTNINVTTNETIHSSVLQQPSLHPELVIALNLHPEIIEPLHPLEERSS